MSASPAVRPLPPRPSLDYERKEAKALLRRLRAGDPDALARARERHPTLDASAPERLRLADAQLVVAREYGFASWPRLVRWFGDVERQRHGRRYIHGGVREVEGNVRWLLDGHRARRPWAGRSLAAYVPRFYGAPVGEVLDSAITEEDARLAVARGHGAPSWAALIERLETGPGREPGDWERDPMPEAAAAIEAGDLAALERVTTAYPVLLDQVAEQDIVRRRTLMSVALWQERSRGAEATRPVMAWLTARGFDRQRELDARLLGHISMSVEEVRDLLAQGADPARVADNGIPVLEHALLRYWNGAAVDVLVPHVTPRSALWIAAGLGDVEGVSRFLDRRGRPTAAARRLRPDSVAVGAPGIFTPLPDADDEELLVETMLVAVLNGRAAVIEYLAARGAPLDSVVYETPLVNIAVGNAMTATVESFVRAGASLDVRGRHPDQTARELARSIFEQMPNEPARRRVVELCGLDPDAILAERDARPVPPPEVHSTLRRALALAADDAARLAKAEVRPENLLVGLLRGGGPPFHVLKSGGAWGAGALDVERLRADHPDRFHPADDRVDRAAPPLDADAEAALAAAIAFAAAGRREVVYELHLLHALTASEDGAVARLLADYGASAATVHAHLERSV